MLFEKSMGLTLCTSRSYRPENHGMANFVKMFQHNYVWLGDLSDAEVVLRQLSK